jgi:SWI/SNF-related matrix-associated actin-dependent regulator 1 of chromatin subfamily A
MANGRKDRQFAHAVASGIAGVFIVNYDTLIEYVGIEKNADTGRWSRNGTGPLAKSTWDVLVADECHMAKNPKAQRSAALYALDATTRLALTGTPIVNRPKELFPIVNWLDRGHWGNWKHFVSRYCGAHETRFGLNTTGATNLEELQTRLRETVMVRRLKRDVLKELPAKRRQVIEVEATGDAANLVARQMMKWMQHDSAMRQAEADMRAAQEANDEQAYREAVDRMSAEYKVAFEEMARERRELAVAKVPYVIEHVDAMREAGINKIVLFAHHHDVIDKLRTHYGRSAVVIDGRVSKDDRQTLVDAFQTRDDIEIFIGGIIPAGVGLTLTASAHVVFAELDWVPGNMSQAEDRCHRIGQANSVLVQHIVFTESLDAKMAKTLVDKQRVIERGLDKRGKDVPTVAVPVPDVAISVVADRRSSPADKEPAAVVLPLTGTDNDYAEVPPF